MDKETLLSIGRPQKTCANCNAPIDSVDRHPSTLKEEKEKRVERQDFCPECWDHIKNEAYDSFWITRRQPREKKVRKLNRRERSVALRALFESLWDKREEEELAAHLFFLSHLLMKWGGLKWLHNAQDLDGREVVVFEDPTSGDRIDVTDVPVDDESIALIKLEIEEFLKQYAAEDEEIAL